MKKLFSVILAGFCLIFLGCAMAQNIVSDVRTLRETNKAADIDIAPIVEQYIHIGAAQAQVEAALKAQKFASHFQPVAADGTLPLIAIFKEKSLLNFGFHDEIRVIVFFENGAVKSTSGVLIYRAL